MSENEKCPKCGAKRKPKWIGAWECESGGEGEYFTQSYGCRIAELEAENVRLREDQQWMHEVIGELCQFFSGTAPMFIVDNVRRLKAEVERLRAKADQLRRISDWLIEYPRDGEALGAVDDITIRRLEREREWDLIGRTNDALTAQAERDRERIAGLQAIVDALPKTVRALRAVGITEMYSTREAAELAVKAEKDS
jgi:hypothetical protein